MDFKLKVSQREKLNPEVAARDFCSEIRGKIFWLEYQTYKPENLQKARTQMHLLRDEYNRNRGSGYCSRLVQFADGISQKVSEIVNLNPEDWNNYRRGQRFWRLKALLGKFEIEWIRARQSAEPPGSART